MSLNEVKKVLNINEPLDDFFAYSMSGSEQVAQTIFGIKDTLQPTSEYVAEIKNSEEYKTYIVGLDALTLPTNFSNKKKVYHEHK